MNVTTKLAGASRRLAKQFLGRDLWVWPEIAVPNRRFGSDYGGWVVCTDDDLHSRSVVYSVGVGEDVTFDLAMIEAFDCEIFAFDPTPRSANWIKTQVLPPQFRFHPWGLADFDGRQSFAAPDNEHHVSYSAVKPSPSSAMCDVCRLTTIMQKLGHAAIDILKMDIEGSEYKVIADLLRGSIRPRQLLVEFHHDMYGIAMDETRNALQILESLGYKIFSIAPTGREYSFIRQS